MDDEQNEAPAGRPYRPTDEALSEIKKEINNVLWMHAPPSLNLGAAEELAVEFYDKIVALWEKEP